MIKSQRCAVAALLVLVASAAWAGYNVQVNVAPDLRESADSVAIVPMDCPGSLDCLWIEERLAQELAAHGIATVIPAETVRQAMFEFGLTSMTEKAKPLLAARLKVRAFAIPLIHSSEKSDEGAVGVWIGSTIVMAPSDVAKGRAELLLVSAETGKLLLRGSGAGESEFRGQKGVVLKIFREILKKAFPGNVR